MRSQSPSHYLEVVVDASFGGALDAWVPVYHTSRFLSPWPTPTQHLLGAHPFHQASTLLSGIRTCVEVISGSAVSIYTAGQPGTPDELTRSLNTDTLGVLQQDARTKEFRSSAERGSSPAPLRPRDTRRGRLQKATQHR